MLHQLKEAEIDQRLISTIQNIFAEKSGSENPQDIENLQNLATDIRTALAEHQGLTLRIVLLQRFIMYGVNHPHLVSYYFDVFTKHSKTYAPKEKREFVKYLIKKTQVPEYYCFYPGKPSLLEAIHTQLRAWINDIDRKKYRFDSLEENYPTPHIKLQHTPHAFMQITRLMSEANIIRRTENLDLFFEFISRVVVSKNGNRYSPKTVKNSYEYRNPEDLQNTINLLDKMKQIAEKKLDEMLRK